MVPTAIVTGASRGIGRAIAARLLDEGWEIYNFDREPPSEKHHLNDNWVNVDLTNADDLNKKLDKILSQTPVQGIVNNAGIVGPEPIDDFTIENFDKVMTSNARSAAQIVHRVVPSMRRAKFGRIVNIASRAALGKHNRTAYSAAKASLISMSRVWTLELAKDGITCNAIAPGSIGTKLWKDANPMDDPRSQAILDSIPVGRIGSPEDVANGVSFFMDKRSDFITGQTLFICGGLSVARAGS